MFHRIGLKVGAKISEGEFERALIFCGTGMGIHRRRQQVPHVHAAVCESVPPPSGPSPVTTATCWPRALSYPPDGHRDGGRLLNNNSGRRLRGWPNFYEFHKLAYDELEAFDYEAFKRNGFEVERLGDYPLADMMNERPD